LLILAAPSHDASNPTPSIASSSYPSSYPTSDDENEDAVGGPPVELNLPSPTPALLIEVQLLYLFLLASSTRFTPSSAVTQTATTNLTPTIREVISPLTFLPLKNLEALLPLAALKSNLALFAVTRGWEQKGTAGGMGTTGIYSLVSKRVLRIDRRGGAMVGWVINE
jgi:hypothetical protein